MVRIRSERGDWVGFVNVRWLQQEDAESPFVLATIIDISPQGDMFTARIPGHTPTGNFFQGLMDRARERGRSITGRNQRAD